MTAVADKLAALEAALAEQEVTLRRKTKTTVIVYAILVGVVAGYTFYVAKLIKELTSKEALTEHIQSALSGIVPERRQAIIDQLKSSAPDLAKTAVGQIEQTVIPTIEQQAKGVLDKLAGTVVKSIREKVVPDFAEFLRKDANTLKQAHSELLDKESSEAVVLLFISIIEEELDKYLNDRFIHAVGDLRKEVMDLTKKGARLTRREDAQRRVLINWAYLAEHKDVGTSLYFDLLQDFKKKVDFVKEDEE